MAKLLLSCDDYVYRHNGKYYAARQEMIDFYQRYLRVFDEVRLVSRYVEEETLKPDRIPLDNYTNIEYIPVPEFHGPKEYIKVYSQVGRALRNVVCGCDAAVLRIPSTVAQRVGRMVMKSGIPYACEVVFDAEDGWHGAKGISKLVWRKIDREMRQLCNRADGVSCVTEHYLQKHYYSTKEGSFTSHYSSLALPLHFFGAPQIFPVKKPLVISHIANQIQYDGRKGHVEVIKAVKKLKDKGVEVVVRFAGKDYYGGVERLRALAGQLKVLDQIEFMGFLTRKELDVFLSDSDIYVMPTRAEGLPRVIIEAMAKGLPCITTPVSGNPELIDEHFLVPYEDFSSLADRIEELTMDAKLYKQTSLSNFERSKKYEASILEKRRDEFYHHLKEKIHAGILQ